MTATPYLISTAIPYANGARRAPGGAPVEWVEESSYFFRLSAYQDRLLALYEEHPEFIVPEKYRNEIKSFVKRGLADISISRTTFDWGILVPGDVAHVMYVWVDALTNYITATGYPDLADPRRKYWPAGAHVIGKDITRFHCIFWPAFLMSAGQPVPKQVVVHGFLLNKGEKMSKTVGNVIDPFALAAHYGADQLRYFLLREVPFGSDGNYSHEGLVNRINADLANDLGNLAQRSLAMINKSGGRVPAHGVFRDNDAAILAAARALPATVRADMAQFQLHLALQHIWELVADANRYFASEEPWRLAKSDPGRRDSILYATAELLRVIAILTQPFIPAASARLLDQLAVPADARMLGDAESAAAALAPGTPLPAPSGIFPRYVEPEAPAR